MAFAPWRLCEKLQKLHTEAQSRNEKTAKWKDKRRLSLRVPLDGECDGVASAEAQGGDAAPHVALGHLVKERDQNARSRCADGVPKRHRAAVDVGAGGVAGGHRAVLLENRPELRQGVERGVRAGRFVGVKHRWLAFILPNGDGDDLTLEATTADGVSRAEVAFQSVGVLPLAGDLIFFRHQLP